MIPVSWDEKPIGKIAKTSSGGTPKRDIKEFYEGGTINWFKTGELVTKYVYTSEEKITEQALKESSAKLFPKETLLVAMYGATIGKMSILKEDSATNQACCAILPNEKYNTEYLYYQLSFLKNKLINRGAGGAQPNISQDIIQTFPVPLPNKNEQQKIASILSTWDKAIELKEKLIEQKKELKKGLMQKLLTGEVRLPGFEGEWIEYQVGEICTLTRGRVISKKEMEENIGIYPVYSSQTSNEGKIGSIDTYDFDGEYVTWTTDGANAGTVFYRNGKFNCTNVCGVLKLKREDIDARYLAYVLASNTGRYVVRHGNPKLMNNIMEIIPVKIFNNFEFQKYICDFFDIVDKEINLIEKETYELKQQKKGLMQLLLTGKVRVKV